MKRRRILALLLVFSLLLSGCGSVRFVRQLMGLDTGMYFSPYGIKRLVPFSQMAYERPDADELERLFSEAAQLAEAGDDADATMDALERAFAAYSELYTADTIAMIHADADTRDLYYPDEYAYCELLTSQAAQWNENTLKACAESPCRKEMEDAEYFLPGELDYYLDSDDYNDELVALYQKEDTLIADYRDLLADPEVELDGKTVKLNEYLAGPVSDDEYRIATETYLRQINREAAEIYCDLIRVRREIAEANGYESCEEFMYDSYGRDYTPQEVAAFLSDIQRDLAPYQAELTAAGIYDSLEYPAVTEAQVMDILSKSMEKLGPPASSDFRFMRNYELCDATPSLNKSGVSYTTYLPAYGVPYILVSAYGDIEDLLYTAHEFGHFLVAQEYGNGCASLDLDEVYSQGMEYLTLCNLQGLLNEDDYQALVRIKVMDSLASYVDDAIGTAFEKLAFELPDDELTPEKLNSLYQECLEAYGNPDASHDDVRLYWTQVAHIFEYPFYMLSYSTSVDAAMQIWQKELEKPGAGWECYQALMEECTESFLPALKAAGLESPLAEGRTAQALSLLKSQFPED